MSATERELRRMLAELAREYQEYAAPIRAALARIEALKPPRAIFISTEELRPGVLEKLSALGKTWVSTDPAAGDDRGMVTLWRKLDGGKLELVKEMTPEEFTAAQDNGRAWPQADNE